MQPLLGSSPIVHTSTSQILGTHGFKIFYFSAGSNSLLLYDAITYAVT